MPSRGARLLAYVLLAGLVTGLTAGVVVFGLPVRLPEGEEPQLPLVARVLSLGLGLDDAAVILGVAAVAFLTLAAWLDLRRQGGRDRQ